MYKYYALKDTIEEIPDSIEPIAFQNFNEAKDIIIKKHESEKSERITAFGFLLSKTIISKADLEKYNWYDAGIVDRHTCVSELPSIIQEALRREINQFYKKSDSNYSMNRENFLSFYGSFKLEDLHRMMPRIANKYNLISDKDKSPIEKLFDDNIRIENIEHTITSSNSSI